MPELIHTESVTEYLAVLEQPQVLLVTQGEQGPPGRPGTDGADISPDEGNQLTQRPNGLYVAPTWASSDW